MPNGRPRLVLPRILRMGSWCLFRSRYSRKSQRSGERVTADPKSWTRRASRRMVTGVNYFFRSTTTILAGRRAQVEEPTGRLLPAPGRRAHEPPARHTADWTTGWRPEPGTRREAPKRKRRRDRESRRRRSCGQCGKLRSLRSGFPSSCVQPGACGGLCKAPVGRLWAGGGQPTKEAWPEAVHKLSTGAGSCGTVHGSPHAASSVVATDGADGGGGVRCSVR